MNILYYLCELLGNSNVFTCGSLGELRIKPCYLCREFIQVHLRVELELDLFYSPEIRLYRFSEALTFFSERLFGTVHDAEVCFFAAVIDCCRNEDQDSRDVRMGAAVLLNGILDSCELRCI